MRNLSNALAGWEKALGRRFVITDAASVKEAEAATLPTSGRVLAILKPGNRKQVQVCVRVANKYRVPLYPISTGKNWGYGSRVPANKAAAVLDLRRLNRILDFNERLAYVTVEPGVTQFQLFHFLRKKKSRLILGATGSSPDTSLIGNILERGFAQGLNGDRSNQVCAFEVILPTGELIHTSFDRYPGAKTSRVARQAAGPALEGLFAQSNLGIVMRMTLWLRQIPPYLQIASLWISNRNLEKVIDALRDAVAESLVAPVFGMSNDYKCLAALLGQYPWLQAKERLPMPLAVKNALRRRFELVDWQGNILMPCLNSNEARIRRTRLRHLLRDRVDEVHFWGATANTCLNLLTDKRQFPKTSWESTLRSFLGYPQPDIIKFAYWRKKDLLPSSLDPDRDRCGLIWVPATSPFEGKSLNRVTKLMRKKLLQYGFEPLIGFSCISERCSHVIAAIVYDRTFSEEENRAMKCYRELVLVLHKAGYHSYRLSIESMVLMGQPRDHSQTVLRRLKKALDPQGILSPGRYIY
jgi:4-cresol dehydrogenase (hydroxylating)